MSVIGNGISENTRGDLGLSHHTLPFLLIFAGIGLVVGYTLHLSGFGGWMTLAVSGASLIAASALWRFPSQTWLLAVVVAVEGAILCTMALPNQLGSGDTMAALANLTIIAIFIVITAKILRRPS